MPFWSLKAFGLVTLTHTVLTSAAELSYPVGSPIAYFFTVLATFICGKIYPFLTVLGSSVLAE